MDIFPDKLKIRNIAITICLNYFSLVKHIANRFSNIRAQTTLKRFESSYQTWPAITYKSDTLSQFSARLNLQVK
jgi:hypothetical protein